MAGIEPVSLFEVEEAEDEDAEQEGAVYARSVEVVGGSDKEKEINWRCSCP